MSEQNEIPRGNVWDRPLSETELDVLEHNLLATLEGTVAGASMFTPMTVAEGLRLVAMARKSLLNSAR